MSGLVPEIPCGPIAVRNTGGARSHEKAPACSRVLLRGPHYLYSVQPGLASLEFSNQVEAARGIDLIKLIKQMIVACANSGLLRLQVEWTSLGALIYQASVVKDW